MANISTVARIDTFEKTLDFWFDMAKGFIMATYTAAKEIDNEEFTNAVITIGKDKVTRFVADIVDATSKLAAKYILEKE